MFGPCKTVRIQYDNEDGFCEINESDFDAEKHQLYEQEAAHQEDGQAPTKRAYVRKEKQPV